MRHSNHNRKLGRETDQRRALLRSLAHSLILKERIQTTEARAKEVRPFVEKLVTKAITGTVAARRDVLATMAGDTGATTRLFKTIAPRYSERAGGYTRIVKTAARKGDAAKMAVIEFI
jgi:large subunit ribosomal protein L17